MYTPDLVAGNWYSDAQARTGARVVVIGQALADKAHVGVGEQHPVQDRGRTRLAPGRRDQQQRRRSRDGPAPARHAAVGPSEPRARSTTTGSAPPPGTTPRSTGSPRASRTRSPPAATRRPPWSATSRSVTPSRGTPGLTTSVTVLGLLIVAISLVGLVNAITMSVIERTREIGMLRCVGARAKDVRRIFTVEGLTVAILGWLIGDRARLGDGPRPRVAHRLARQGRPVLRVPRRQHRHHADRHRRAHAPGAARARCAEPTHLKPGDALRYA